MIDRIKQIIKHFGLTQSAFAEKMDMKQQNLSRILNGKANIGDGVINKIVLSYDVNKDWLLTGEGEMLKENQSPVLQPKLMTNVIMVPLVSQYAYAGYLASYADAEYLGTLPTVPMIADHDPKGVYYAFETKGGSMNDGSIDGLKEGDLLFGRLIQQNLWRYKIAYKEVVFCHCT